MDVNFNNLRVQAMITYDSLSCKLNAHIDNEGVINIHARELQKDMDELKQLIGGIACVFEKDNEKFKMVRDEATMAWFNPDADSEAY
jgi:hypothetical protein